MDTNRPSMADLFPLPPSHNKFDLVQVLSARTIQLGYGAVPNVDTLGETDPFVIARMELRQGRVPLRVVRSPT